MARWRGAVGLLGLSLLASALAFTVPIKDEDSARQTCSGMWAGPDTAIEGVIRGLYHWCHLLMCCWKPSQLRLY
jgi:hypothetical protein